MRSILLSTNSSVASGAFLGKMTGEVAGESGRAALRMLDRETLKFPAHPVQMSF